jgi:putative SOS response-associated peptidase YedK
VRDHPHVRVLRVHRHEVAEGKHRFSLTGSPILGVAGLWREGKGNAPNSFTLLTTQLGPDVAPHPNRQIVVLQPADWKAWLS